MGFFNNLKNSLTGGWADVSVITGEARRETFTFWSRRSLPAFTASMAR